LTSRVLTSAEVALARSIFGDAIAYDRVRAHNRKWWPLQPDRVTMAPDGDLWFPPKGGLFCADFCDQPLHLQGHFIHEMTHVWQAQRGGKWFLPLMRHPFCRYGYQLRDGQRFDRYGLEQQAEIVRHRFLADHGRALTICPPRDILPFS